jgi:hypothetical protein
MQYVLRLAVVLLLLSSCNKYKAKYPYSLRDFNPELREQLEMVVSNGGMCNDRIYDSSLVVVKQSSIADLEKLADCEHPIIRAYAFTLLCHIRDSSTRKILFNHLDDTAYISNCRGEWGEQTDYVADYFIYQTEEISNIPDSILRDEVILNHSNLSHAYLFISDLENHEEKYYDVIKEMTNIKGRKQNAYDLELLALSALSKYNRKEDIPLIAEKLSTTWRSAKSEYCFYLIERNPDTAYFSILELYYRIISRENNIGARQYIFYTGRSGLGIKYNSFLEALVRYKNKKSSEMIADILKREIYPVDLSNSPKGENYHYKIYTLLKANECAEYINLINQLKPEALKFEKQQKGKLIPVL